MNPSPFMNGFSRFSDMDKAIVDLPWNHHPVFKGVSMKHLVTGAETNGQLSLHLVRIVPDCAIGLHQHPAQWELHQVLEGSGETLLNGKTLTYVPGTVGTIPLGENHEVCAGKAGLLLLATFSPSLV